MKYLLWAGTILVLVLFGFTLWAFLSPAPHPSLAQQAQSAPATTPFAPIPNSTPSERFLSGEASAALSESTEGASSPAPVLDDPKKAAALQELVKTRAEMQTLRPPQINTSDPGSIAGSINSYVNQMGQRAQSYNRARAALQEQLSPAEAARLNQILSQPAAPGQ